MITSQAYATKYPGLSLKAWVLWQPSATIIKADGIPNIVRNAVGNYTLTIAAGKMASATYFVEIQIEGDSPNTQAGNFSFAKTTLSLGVYPADANNTSLDLPNKNVWVALYE